MADIIGNRIKVLVKEHASGEYVEDVTPDLIQAQWTWKAHGGIESFEVVLARTSAGLSGFICPIVEIWCQDADNGWTMVCAGHALHLIPMIESGRLPTLTLVCAGFLQQLKWVYIDSTWDSTTLDAVVEDVIDNTVVGWTGVDVSRWTAKTTAGSGTTITNLEFDGVVYDLIASLAEEQGSVIWGVIPQLISGAWYSAKFYFVDTSATVNNHFFASDMSNIAYDYNIDRIKNSYRMRGDYQLDDGDTLDTTGDDSTSQTSYGKREEVIDNCYIDNPTDAETYLAAIENVLKNPGRSLGFTLSNKTVGDRLERNIAVGVSKVWDVFADANNQSWHCNSVTYVAKSDGRLDMYVNLGEKLGVRQIYPPGQAGAPGGQPSRNYTPYYGRGGYNPLNPNFNEVDWGRKGPGGRYYTKDYWSMVDAAKKGKK